MTCKHCKKPIREMNNYELHIVYGRNFQGKKDYVHSADFALASCDGGQHYAEPASVEIRKCSVCGVEFESEDGFVSCPAHSFGERDSNYAEPETEQ